MAADFAELPILVTGGSGQLARLVLAELMARGVPPDHLITTSRTPGRIADLSARGVEVRYADHDRPETLVDAFRGARRMLLISGTPQAFIAGIRVRQHEAAIAAAIAAGVPHLFYTSAPHAAPETPADAHVDHWQTEQLIKHSGAKWTILRHWEWPDWHLEHHWRPAVDAGVFHVASGEGRISHVTREDTAAADAGALLDPECAGRTFDVTGPEALTARDVWRYLRQASGKDIRLEQTEPGELAARLLSIGTHPETAPVFGMIANAIREGCYDGLSDEPERLAGRPRVTMGRWLETALPEVLSRPARGPWD